MIDVQTALAGIESLSVDDRIELVHAIWDSIEDNAAASLLTDVQKREIDRRIDDDPNSPTSYRTWDEIKARIRNRPS